MDRELVDWAYAFAQITFPILLLLPQFSASFRMVIKPEELYDYLLILCGYFVVLCAIGFFYLQLDDDIISVRFFLGFLPIILLSLWGLFYYGRWILQEHTHQLLQQKQQENLATESKVETKPEDTNLPVVAQQSGAITGSTESPKSDKVDILKPTHKTNPSSRKINTPKKPKKPERKLKNTK